MDQEVGFGRMYQHSDYPGLNRRGHCFTQPSTYLPFGIAKLATPSLRRPVSNADSSRKIADGKLKQLRAVDFSLRS